jgi:hypothetical protein
MPKNTNKTIRYFGEIVMRPNGRYQVKHIQRLIGVNQHRRKWVDVSGSEFAKELNKANVLAPKH